MMRLLIRLRDTTDEEGAVAQIKGQVDFRGGNLWALIFAILVASAGLNVNSTAVIIGAMLISPLMGPIMGAGLGLGINDLPLLRRSIRNLAIAAAVSLMTSALYFAVSPLAEAQSELLARTRPTLYDVLIALAGGSAGIVAVTRRGDSGNVIPGVAIATALMPPLCTAGFGLANGEFGFMLGALYLFVINSVLICLATLAVVRLLRFRRVAELDPQQAVRQRRWLGVATALTVVPSAFVGYQVVQESRFDSAARRFVAERLQFPDRTVLRSVVRHGRDSSTIEATLMGRPLSADVIQSLRSQLDAYGLQRTRLVLNQPEAGAFVPEQIGQAVRVGIIEDIYKRNEAALQARDAQVTALQAELQTLRRSQRPMADVARELVALYPTLTSVLLGTAAQPSRESAKVDSVATVVVGWQRVPGIAERRRVDEYLSRRLSMDSLVVSHILTPPRR